MYHSTATTLQSQSADDASIRIFSPIILFHDAKAAEYCSDNQLIELKKQKVDAMLKTNVQFWSNVIQNTRRQDLSPPETPPPCSQYMPTSPTSSSCSSHKWYSAPPHRRRSRQRHHQRHRRQEQNEEDAEDEEHDDAEGEEEDEIDEIEDSESEKEQHVKPKGRKSVQSNTGNNKAKVANNNGRRRRGNLPKSVTAILKQWLIDHSRHPYPTEEEKRGLRIKTDLTLNQISNWFINARRRILPLIVSNPPNAFVHETTEDIKKRASKKRKASWTSEGRPYCPIVKGVPSRQPGFAFHATTCSEMR
ncbi:serine palmitoyltransferase component [Mucor velutinosus]|uniref:Serine palmitoyltransferase component n=1 Tax=Mucor velutinosus TaxID=708070 RepID=A0AAN7DIQ7_9FUNG|nr:serine palmitoyltransferase component [Mucor velutinosus]